MTRMRIRYLGPSVGLVRQSAIMSERKRIADWLRAQDGDGLFNNLAEAIEAGRHNNDRP